MVAHRGRQRPEKIGLDTGKRFGYHAPNRRLAMVAPWPNDARVAVMFTFDFDAESGWLSRDPSPRDRPGVISQGTYGAKVGVPRILDLLKAENVPATFFIPGWVVEHHPGTSIVELPVQWDLDDAPFFMFHPTLLNRPMNSPEIVYGIWRDEFLGMYEWGGLFNLTCHPQVIGHPSRLLMLRRLIRFIKEHARVWWATGSDVAQHWLARGRA